MQVWPAIDLRGGKCVRLQQGDYGRETVFGDDPAAMARHWVDEGAECLHLVDLDGAKAGRPANLESVRAILKAVRRPLRARRRHSRRRHHRVASRAGPVAAGDRHQGPPRARLVSQALPPVSQAGSSWASTPATAAWPPTAGWRPATPRRSSLPNSSTPSRSPRLIYTDIATDGMLAGPNLAAMREMQQAVRLPVIASGGVTTADDVAKPRQSSASPAASSAARCTKEQLS